jgi:nucleoside-diphosphate-sugar epimerase
MHLMVLGAGYSGKAIAAAFLKNGFKVSGTTRSPEKVETLSAIGVNALLFDGAQISSRLQAELQTVTHLIQSISPSGGNGGSDLFLDLIGHDLKSSLPRLEWIAYLSTVGVYGDHGGAWVDEDTTPHPVSHRSVERLAAEQAWSLAAEKAQTPLSIMRLSGIYGPGRNAFVNLQQGRAKRLIKAGQVFNRIRVEDIASACTYLSSTKSSGIFNITDDEPAPPQDLITFAASLAGINPPPGQPFETASLTPMARSFYGENKRVSNAKIRSLGFVFRYPEYRNSLTQLWESGQEIGYF